VCVAGVVPAGYPEIVENPTWRTVQKDAEATLTCSAAGDPVPTVSWLKNFVPLNMTDPRISVLPSGRYTAPLPDVMCVGGRQWHWPECQTICKQS